MEKPCLTAQMLDSRSRTWSHSRHRCSSTSMGHTGFPVGSSRGRRCCSSIRRRARAQPRAPGSRCRRWRIRTRLTRRSPSPTCYYRTTASRRRLYRARAAVWRGLQRSAMRAACLGRLRVSACCREARTSEWVVLPLVVRSRSWATQRTLFRQGATCRTVRLSLF